MSKEDIENQINEAKNKIMVLNKCLNAFNKYKCSITDEFDLQQCENQIQDYIIKLQYLKYEYKKLLKNKEELENGNDFNITENKLLESKNMAAYEFLQNPKVLTTEKIVYRMKKIHNKLLIENKFKTDTEKFMNFLKSTNIPVNSNQYIEAKTKIEESKNKILCLNNALKIYKDIYLGPTIDFVNDEKTTKQESVSSDMKNNESKIENECLRPLQSGMIQIKVISVSKLNVFSPNVNLSAVISVNGKQFATSLNKFGRWNEFFDIPDDKDVEVDLMIKENNSYVVSLLWFKPSELREAEALRKQLLNENGEDYGLYNLKLEPSGEIQLMMKYVYKKKQNDLQSSIQRRNAHKFILNKLGHKLVSTDSYNINRKCAVCNGIILSGSLHCIDCRFLCHSKCAPKIITKCITIDNSEDNDSINLLISKYNIPHKFTACSNIVGGWCCHCGLMLPIGKNQISKCTECDKCCHHECKIYIPNLCGMSPKMAELFLNVIEKYEQENKLNKIISLRKYHSDLINSISIKAPKKTIKRPTLDDFHFITVLGRGSFGKVMLAEEKNTKKFFAVKMLKKQYIVQKDIKNMMSEKSVFLTISSNNHPFLVNLHSCFTSSSCIYFVMEYVQGGDLIYHVRQFNFTTKRAKFYSCEVLLALEYLHQNKIVYRDLKLENILLTAEGHIKLTDYGLCKENMDANTTTNTFCGTPEFLAPELIRGRPYTRAIDWWTFGVLLYEMLTRSPPFKGKNKELYNNILKSEPIYHQFMEYNAIHLISRLLIKDPKNRLGASEADAKDIKKHPFYKNVDWQAVLEKRVPVPYIPKFKNKLDISYFDDQFTKLPIHSSSIQYNLNESEQELFRDFTYVNPLMD